MKPLVVYDLDGTLVDTFSDVSQALNATLAKYGLPEVDDREIGRHFGQGVRSLIAGILGTEQPNKIDRFVEEFRALYHQGLSIKSRFYPGMMSLLDRVASTGSFQAVLTNKPEYLSKQLLKELGALHFFDPVVGPDTYDALKPDPKGLIELIRYHQSSPRQTVMIGDSESDIEVAKKAGVCSIAVLYGYRNPEALFNSQPDYVAETVGQLEHLLLNWMKTLES